MSDAKKCSTGSTTCGTQNWNLAASIGGSGAGASNGGAVTVTNAGQISTSGGDAADIFAQSVGGGGGTGADGNNGLIGPALNAIEGITGVSAPSADGSRRGEQTVGSAHPDATTPAPPTQSVQQSVYQNLQLNVGGSGGSSGDGANVNVTNSGALFATGDGSQAIFAQSVGGGGGVGGAGSTGVKGGIGIGGSGGSSGNGGDVAVTNSGMITTSGAAGYGVFAQSIGGGGGAAGNINRGLGKLDLGQGIAVGNTGGGGGNGGKVTVNNTGDIVTSGVGAEGIFVQSIGGGGGVAGNSGNSLTATSAVAALALAGSAGAAGAGGDVNVVETGNITTSGANADGIFAQSVGGQGKGGNVNVTVIGSVVALGAGSDGVVAQSTGGTVAATQTTATSLRNVQGSRVGISNTTVTPQDAGATNSSGNVTVTITDGTTIQAGPGAVGVRLVGGANNVLVNDGTIMTSDGLNGTAVSDTDGNNTIQNNGYLVGSLALGSGKSDLTNTKGYVAGTVLGLGTGTFTNLGQFSVGGTSNVGVTTLTGSFVQFGGDSLVDLDLSHKIADQLNLNAVASIGGNVDLTLLNIPTAVPGTYKFDIVTAAGGLTAPNVVLNAPVSAIASYGLSTVNNTDLRLTWTVNFSPSFGPDGDSLGYSNSNFGNYLGRDSERRQQQRLRRAGAIDLRDSRRRNAGDALFAPEPGFARADRVHHAVVERAVRRQDDELRIHREFVRVGQPRQFRAQPVGYGQHRGRRLTGCRFQLRRRTGDRPRLVHGFGNPVRAALDVARRRRRVGFGLPAAGRRVRRTSHGARYVDQPGLHLWLGRR